MKKLSELSLFLPAFNEEKVIAQTIAKADTVLRGIAKKYEILVINDGSTDKTKQIVKQIIGENPLVRIISHNTNNGYGAAFKTGLYQSKYKLITYIDADGQFDFAEINNFIKYINDFDLVIGFRKKRADSNLRIFIAYLLKFWNLFWFHFWLKDPDCGFKLIKKEVIKKIPKLQTESAITETEFLIRVKKANFKIKEIPVHHYPRTTGTSTGGNYKVIFKAASETLKLWWILMNEKK